MYNIKYERVDDVGGFSIPIVEEINFNDCFGDSIGLDKETNSLWVSSFLNVSHLDFMSEPELEDFFRSNFKNPSGVKGFIRRQILNL